MMRRLLLYFNLILGFVLMSPSAIAQYCTTGLYSTGCAVGDQIDGFSMGGFSNSATGCSTGGWGDYTSDTVTVALGSVNTFTITYGTAYIQYGAMWIDWNNDQDFDDPGEHVWSSSTNAASHTDNAVIPLTPAVGNYRMRIRSDFSNAMAANGSCTPSTWGEAEDYTLKVTPAPACAPPIFISASNITSSSAVIHWQSLDTTFNVEYGPAGFTPGTGTTVATNPDSLLISGLLANTAYDVYVQNDCSASGAGTSTWTGPFTFMTSCVSVAVYPTTESFDGSTWAPSTPGWPYSGDTVDQCWSRSADISTQFAWVVRSGTSGGWQTGPTGDHTSGVGNYLCAKGNNFGGNDSIFFYTPDYDLSALNVPLLSFYYHMFGGNGLGDIVVQGSTNGTNWVTLTTLSGQKQTASSDAYVEEIVDITSVKSSATKLRFVGVKNNGTMDMAIDDVRIEEAPPCPKPTGFNFTNITSSGTDINFLSQGHSFPVEWGLSGFVQGTGTQDTVYMSGASLTGMPSNSLIDVYIQNDCTDSAKGVSTWAGPFTFRTLCNAMMHGYAQSFDNLTVPDMDPCWHFITGGGFGVGTAQSYAPFPWNSLQPISPPNIARLSNSSSEYSILITPELYGLDGDTSQIRFDAGQDIFNGLPMSLVMGTMSDRDDTATFVAFDTLNIPANSWQSYTLYLNNVPAGHKFVAFRHGNFNPTFSNFYIEDFFFEPIPSCLPPTNMMATSVTTNSATFTWTQGGSTTVNIEYGPQGFVQGTGTSVSGITVNPYTLTGLPANTCYDVYFQADCGGGDVSPWVGPVSFCTLCNVYTAPFAENFDGGGWIASGNNNGNSIDNCWGSMPMVSDPKVFKWIPRSTGPTSGNGPLNDNTGLNFMYCEASGSVPGDTAYLTTPAIDVSSLNAPALYFDQHRFYSTGTFGLADMDILVSNDFGATWTTVYNVTGNVQTSASDPWSSHIVNLPNYVGDTILVSFRQAGDGCCGDAAIDNVEIKEAPSCPDPANLNVKGITDSSAIFEWVSNNSAATNQVWWGPQGFWQGTGTTGGTMLSTAADSMAVDTLNSAYCYDVYVRTICTGGDTSAWVGPFTFCTLCSPFTAPFIESFNNPGAEPQCWGNYNATGATGLNDIWKNTSVNWPAYGASGVTDNTGNGGYAMGVDGSSSSAKGVRLETPLIDVSALTSPELRFHIFSNNTTNPGDNNPMYIDFFDGSNWNDSIYTYAADSASWVEVIISLSGYTITGPVQFRFNLDKNANPAFYNDVLIDDVIVDNALTCVKPTGVNVSNIGQTSATVNWTTGGATNWQVNYGPSGTAAGAGTWVNVTGGSATLSLTGLMSCSGYDVYVRDSCGPGDVSFWTTVTNFSTLASVQPLPFLENFNNSLSCWTVTSNGSSATETWKHMPTYNGNTLDGTGFGFVDSDAAGSGGVTLDEELTSPPIDASGLGPNDTLWLEFDQYYNNLGDTCYVDVWDGTQWVNVLTQYTSAGGWSSPDHQMIDITMYANANLQVRFHYKDFGIWAWYWAVDNINVHASSSTGCVAPANLAVNNVTCSEADLSWNSDGGTIITFVRWDTAGFNPATGGNLIINPTSPHTITGLMPGYTYDVWVADSCPLGVAASMLQFTTPTAPMPTIGYTANQMTTTANNATWHFDATSSQNGDTYTWDFGGGNMVNGDTASFTYGQNGAYQVTLTITNGCGSVDSTFTVNVQGISIAESALGRSLKVFPNPNNGDFNVSFLLDANEQVDIRVLNPAGQIILSENLGNIDQYDGNINLSHAAKGMYILQIETSQGVINRRVTIQ